MTGTNHMLVGAAIGTAFASPIAVPIAFLSHFILDTLPHYGIDENTARVNDRVWKIDAAFIAILLCFLALAPIDSRLWAMSGAIAALSPDLAWVYRFVIVERFGSRPPVPKLNSFNHFHASIQKRESPKLLWVEGAAMVVFLGFFAGVAF